MPIKVMKSLVWPGSVDYKGGLEPNFMGRVKLGPGLGSAFKAGLGLDIP